METVSPHLRWTSATSGKKAVKIEIINYDEKLTKA
jgi:hypothetical protein